MVGGGRQVMAEEQSLSLSTFPYFHILALCHYREREILKGNLWTTCLIPNSSHKRVSMIKLIHPKGNQPSIFIGRTDADAPMLWPPDAKNWLIGKDPDAGKDWGQEETGTTEDEMVEWHQPLHGHEFEQALENSERQWRLACCSPWGPREIRWDSDWTTTINFKGHLLRNCIKLAFLSTYLIWKW